MCILFSFDAQCVWMQNYAKSIMFNKNHWYAAVKDKLLCKNVSRSFLSLSWLIAPKLTVLLFVVGSLLLFSH